MSQRDLDELYKINYRDNPDDDDIDPQYDFTKNITREKLLEERLLLSANPYTNRSKIEAINKLLDSLPNDTPNEQVYKNDYSKEVTSLKEVGLNTLGCIGIIGVFLLRILIAVLPFVMIGGGFLLTLLLTTIECIFPLTTVIFWVWGLVCAIQGVQDIWAIMFYIAFVVIWIPFFIYTTKSVFKKR